MRRAASTRRFPHRRAGEVEHPTAREDYDRRTKVDGIALSEAPTAEQHGRRQESQARHALVRAVIRDEDPLALTHATHLAIASARGAAEMSVERWMSEGAVAKESSLRDDRITGVLAT